MVRPSLWLNGSDRVQGAGVPPVGDQADGPQVRTRIHAATLDQCPMKLTSTCLTRWNSFARQTFRSDFHVYFVYFVAVFIATYDIAFLVSSMIVLASNGCSIHLTAICTWETRMSACRLAGIATTFSMDRSIGMSTSATLRVWCTRSSMDTTRTARYAARSMFIFQWRP